MPDRLSKQQRSYAMSRVRSSDTQPEITVRSLLHRAGFRFRKNVRKLPGTPDVALPQYRTVVFVHGCFWHQHQDCPRARWPASNTEFWNAKLDRNVAPDRRTNKELESAGWRVIVVWQCELKNDKLADRLGTEIRRPRLLQSVVAGRVKVTSKVRRFR